jgi:hypothetical protein
MAIGNPDIDCGSSDNDPFYTGCFLSYSPHEIFLELKGDSHMMKHSIKLTVLWGNAIALGLICTLMSEGRGIAQTPGPPPVGNVRVLAALLSGPSIDGVVPGGKASFTSFHGDPSFFVGAFSINLPDSTTLTVDLDGKTVGTMVVLFGNANLLPLSSTPLVHPGSVITISMGDLGGGIITLAPTKGDVILSGIFQAL